MVTKYCYFKTIMGRLLLRAIGDKLIGINFEVESFVSNDLGDYTDDLPVFTDAKRQLEEYFNGKRDTFSVGYELLGTPFQKQVWSYLLSIPYGQRVSYSKFASNIIGINSTRSVASAIAKNPILIILPCHRVVMNSGRLGNYAGGPALKQRLLSLEGSRRE